MNTETKSAISWIALGAVIIVVLWVVVELWMVVHPSPTSDIGRAQELTRQLNLCNDTAYLQQHYSACAALVDSVSK